MLARHAAVIGRIEAACRAAGRATGAVRLLAVSKTQPATAVAALAALGQVDFGENYVDEAVSKIAAVGNLGQTALVWHFIGPIQSNKTRPIAEHFAWVHSIEREKIARRLSEQRPAALPPLQVCIQVNISGEASKSGCTPDQAPALAKAISAMPRLHLRGLMAIPAPQSDPALQRRDTAALRGVFERLAADLRLPGFDTLSIGMSDDLESAVAEGSTMVRIGTALFGPRLPRAV